MTPHLLHAMKAGFRYGIETVRDGEVIAFEDLHNMMPDEGLKHLIQVALQGGTQYSTWYVGIYESPYLPSAGDVGSTFHAVSGEISEYEGSTRRPLVLGTPIAGAVDNLASRAEFTMTVDKTARGAFIAASSARGASSPVLLSAARFTSPKVLTPGDVLRVTAGFDFISL